MEDPIKVSFPKIDVIYWRAWFLGTMVAVGFALCVDLTAAQTLGTWLIANACTIGFAGMMKYGG